MPQKAIIIGAGPAGLTAAYELLKRTDIVPIILEKSGEIGGISRTTNYKGNRMDMGPHRFFSKSDRVMDWWLKMMPLENNNEKEVTISYQNKSREINAESAAPQDPDKVMLVIQRLTRIYFLRKFFAYPIQLTFDTLKTLGLIRTIKIMVSFIWIRLFPRKPEKSLEDFIINKFGRQLYLLFFKDYTEKVWGIAPSEISAEWGAQRIKGVSLSKAITGALKNLKAKKKGGLAQKDTETSLIEQFLYPKYGPGSLWEEVARQVQAMGGKIYMHQDVQKIYMQDGRIHSVNTINSQTGQAGAWEGNYFFSTMPVQELIADMGSEVPADVQEVAAGLQYRDFINVGVLLKQLSTKEGLKLELKDNWIYIQERDVKVGRLMIYNNWGGGMIKDPNTIWIGMEYFCNKTDAFWALDDNAIQAAAVRELEKMDLARIEDVLDITVRRMEKTYPAYFGTYDRFDTIRAYTDKFENLFLVGRNGMHKYNNADHSMLCAMVAVDNIEAGIRTKANLWSINTEQEYHEEKKGSASPVQRKEALAPTSFKEYVLNDQLNRAFLWIAGIALVIEFIVFKILYPYAGFINGDSYVYLQSAWYNLDINTYPVGYSKFLRLFSIFTKSDTALVAFQYFAIQASALWFIFTLFNIYLPGKLTKWLMFSFVIFNPVFLYISNYVSSDSFFLALSLAWFTLLLWILKAPTVRLIILQALVLLLAFMVRYNALYYPLISGIAFLFSRQSVKAKMAGIGASIFVIAAFMVYTSNQYYQFMGIRQFTPFSGWQIANNAMYAYRYVDSADRKKSPARFSGIDNTVRHYFDTSRDLRNHPVEMLAVSTVYMWDPRSPLNKYMKDQFKKDSTASKFKQWSSMAPLYAGYGSYLIRQYPMIYLKYYLVPNALKYYTPPGEFLDDYNMGRDTVAKIAQTWFEYKSQKVRTAFKNFRVNSLDFLPVLAGTMNVLFLLGVIGVCVLQGIFCRSLIQYSLLLAFILWVLNFGFSVFASPITLRYQLFGILVFSSFAFLLIDHIYKTAFIKKVV
ncbi:MAG TPA: NAD(P)-binding protein [Puia sp.]|jgi:protoporphyrinogen oxidase